MRYYWEVLTPPLHKEPVRLLVEKKKKPAYVPEARAGQNKKKKKVPI